MNKEDPCTPRNSRGAIEMKTRHLWLEAAVALLAMTGKRSRATRPSGLRFSPDVLDETEKRGRRAGIYLRLDGWTAVYVYTCAV